MGPWSFFLGFLLDAKGLASPLTTNNTMVRPVVDERNDAALEYVSAEPYAVLMLSAKFNTHPVLLQFMNGLTALEAKTKAGAPCDVSNISKRCH